MRLFFLAKTSFLVGNVALENTNSHKENPCKSTVDIIHITSLFTYILTNHGHLYCNNWQVSVVSIFTPYLRHMQILVWFYRNRHLPCQWYYTISNPTAFYDAKSDTHLSCYRYFVPSLSSSHSLSKLSNSVSDFRFNLLN